MCSLCESNRRAANAALQAANQWEEKLRCALTERKADEYRFRLKLARREYNAIALALDHCR